MDMLGNERVQKRGQCLKIMPPQREVGLLYLPTTPFTSHFGEGAHYTKARGDRSFAGSYPGWKLPDPQQSARFGCME